MMRTLGVIAVILALAGCAATPEALEPRPVPTHSVESAPGLVDSGVADAAGGTVDYDNGVLQSYTAAEGDHVDAIAMRFGITVAALQALNTDLASDELVEAGTLFALR